MLSKRPALPYMSYGIFFAAITLINWGCASAGGAPQSSQGSGVRSRPSHQVPEDRRFACLERRARTANPKALSDARAVLAYLREAPQRPDRRIVTGQFIGGGKFSGLKEINKIHDKTGKWLGMIGNDYALMHAADITGNKYLLEYWEQGGLVTVSFHALNPNTHRFASVKNRNVDIRDLFNPETKAYRTWIKDLDLAAEGLQELQDKGVVVLWRPFHEMNKDFFWWGNRNVDDFVKLWRQTFDYLTHTKGLNNLLWVYSPYQAPDTAKYYPGDNYVDVVAMDAYETDPEKIQGYEQLAAIDKPFGFAEYGPSGNLFVVIPVIQKNVDYYGIVKTILRRFPKTSFLHAWNAGWGFQDHRNIRELMNDPAIISRDDLSWRSICAQ
jgi:mannan endo-1,4-beta-mannosidase